MMQPPVLEGGVHLKVIATGVSSLKEWDGPESIPLTSKNLTNGA